MPIMFPLLLAFTLAGVGAGEAPPDSDVRLLLEKIKPALAGSAPSNPQLATWAPSVPLCMWRGLRWSAADGTLLRCESDAGVRANLSLSSDASLQLTDIHLPAAALAGSLPPALAQLPSLRSLLLPVNSLAGPLPFELGNSPALAELDLAGNSFSGPLPPSLWNLCASLLSLRIHRNAISGEVPRPAVHGSSCGKLLVLDLSGNSLRGPFPEFVTAFPTLLELDLSGNSFSGELPGSLAALVNLKRFNVSDNNFTGRIPPVLSRFGAEAFMRNSESLCGEPLLECGGGGGGGSGGKNPGAVAGVVIGLMGGAVVVVSLLIGWVHGRRRKVQGEEEMDQGAGDGESLMVFQGGEHLTLDDVLNATGQVIEKTSYGTSYKAKLPGGGTIALRLLREGSCRDAASCLPAVRRLARARHENLVPLRAFYEGKRGEKLLISDYFPGRSLHDLLLHRGGAALSWARRHKILLGAARGLAYLHAGEEPGIVHGSVTSRNVVVDEGTFVGRMAGYGLQCLLSPAVAEEIVGAEGEGWIAPELQRGRTKSEGSRVADVYAFGILMLETLMGRGAEEDLPAAVKAAVMEETTMEVFDAELAATAAAAADGIVPALKLAMGCCAPAAAVRPDMGEVVRQLEENRPRNWSALYSPAATATATDAPTPFYY